jgi:hypothetical protein
VLAGVPLALGASILAVRKGTDPLLGYLALGLSSLEALALLLLICLAIG